MAAAMGLGVRVRSRGDQGDEVRALQAARGSPASEQGGDFGPATHVDPHADDGHDHGPGTDARDAARGAGTPLKGATADGTLRRAGATGPAVLEVQRLLGLGPAGQAGALGPTTTDAIQGFERENGLSVARPASTTPTGRAASSQRSTWATSMGWRSPPRRPAPGRTSRRPRPGMACTCASTRGSAPKPSGSRCTSATRRAPATSRPAPATPTTSTGRPSPSTWSARARSTGCTPMRPAWAGGARSRARPGTGDTPVVERAGPGAPQCPACPPQSCSSRRSRPQPAR